MIHNPSRVACKPFGAATGESQTISTLPALRARMRAGSKRAAAAAVIAKSSLRFIGGSFASHLISARIAYDVARGTHGATSQTRNRRSVRIPRPGDYLSRDEGQHDYGYQDGIRFRTKDFKRSRGATRRSAASRKPVLLAPAFRDAAILARFRVVGGVVALGAASAVVARIPPRHGRHGILA